MWVQGKFIKKIEWNNNLFSFFFKANINKFIPGQFSMIRFYIKNKRIQRFYSYVNSNKNKKLEFYISRINNGLCSNFIFNINKHDKFYVTRKSFGNFTLKNIKKSRILWMISNGTAIGPYISMLKSGICFNKFKNIILLHSNSFLKNIPYLKFLRNLELKMNNKLKIFISITKEYVYGLYNKRLNNLLW